LHHEVEDNQRAEKGRPLHSQHESSKLSRAAASPTDYQSGNRRYNQLICLPPVGCSVQFQCDREQLASMAEQAKEATGKKKLQVLADRGYFDSEEILKCEQADIAPLVPRPLTQMPEPRVALTSGTSFTTRGETSIGALQGNVRSGASPPSKAG
jgi:hypothetical protein